MNARRIHGTKRTIQRLIRLCKQASQEGAYRVARRLHAVVLNMEGRTAPEIASFLKVHRSKVSIWLHHWQWWGMDGILDGHRPGGPKELSDPRLQTLGDIVDSGPVAYGFHSGAWTSPMVSRAIKEEFLVPYHPAHVSRILQQLGFSVQRPKKVLARADNQLQSRCVSLPYSLRQYTVTSCPRLTRRLPISATAVSKPPYKGVTPLVLTTAIRICFTYHRYYRVWL